MNEDKSVDILLVEDNVNDAELTLKALREHSVGTRIVHVVDGDEALEFIFASGVDGDWKQGKIPKLILLDMKLQKVSGLDVLRELKSQEQTRVIPVVVLTASDEERGILESYRLGVNSYVVKPTDSRKYARAIGDITHYWLGVNKPPRC